LIVVDASVLANAIADDGSDGALARDALRSHRDLAAPDLVDVETVAVMRKRWLAGQLTEYRFSIAIDDLGDLDLERYATLPLMRHAYRLRANVTVYDATFVALACALRCPLLTGDVRLSNAPGLGCEVLVLGT
jgi:predicted nucleic acid-binding protein